MEGPTDNAPNLGNTSKRLAHQALVIAENRIHLLLLEAQEERDQIFRAFWLSVGLAVFVLLTGIALTLLVVVVCWPGYPVAALAILVLAYAGAALFLFGQLARLRREWQSFSATFNELRKDRECLTRNLL